MHGAAIGRSIWFYWVAGATGPQTFDTVGSSFDTSMAVYTGSSLGALTRVAQSDDADGLRTSKVTVNAVAGTRYSIAVDGAGGRVGSTNGTAPCACGRPMTSSTRPSGSRA